MLGIIPGFFGCTETTTTGISTASIGGVINSIDLNDNQIQNDTGITVSLKGMGQTTTTNSKGYWAIDSIPVGKYTLTFSKSGFGTKILPDYQVNSGQDTVSGITLYQIPAYYVSKLSDSVATGNNVTLNFTLSGAIPQSPGFSNIYVFFGSGDTVSSDTNNYTFYKEFSVEPDSMHYSTQLNQSFFLSYGVTSGQKVFIAAYGGNYSAWGYTNTNSVKTLFTGLDLTPSNIVSFVVP